MFFYPIFIPSSNGPLSSYICPKWVEIIFIIGLSTVLIGLVFFLIATLMEIVFDKDIDNLFRLGATLMFIGVILLIATIPLAIVIGVKVI